MGPTCGSPYSNRKGLEIYVVSQESRVDDRNQPDDEEQYEGHRRRIAHLQVLKCVRKDEQDDCHRAIDGPAGQSAGVLTDPSS